MRLGEAETAPLDKAASLVRRVAMHAGAAQALATNAHRLDSEALRGTLAEVTTQAGEASEGAQKALSLLQSMGAAMPGKVAVPAPVPLRLLSTEAGKRLLIALETAEAAALELDRERGWIDADGGSTGYAESLQMMALQLRQDVEGPKGRD